jgi:hypothetical protein
LGAAPIKESAKDVEVEMNDADKPEPLLPVPERKPAKSSLRKLLKENISGRAIAERVLEQEITLTVAEALALVPDVQKLMWGRFDLPEQMQPVTEGTAARIRRLETDLNGGGLRTDGERVLYTGASPKTTCSVGDRLVDVLIDTGAEVSVMSQELADQCGLHVSDMYELGAHGFFGPRNLFAGIVEKVPVNIGGIIHHTPVWIANQTDFDFILGQTYSFQSSLELKHRTDGSCTGKIFDAAQRHCVKFQAVLPSARSNRYREQLRLKA